MSYLLTSGGCDGCLNIHDPDNKGLESVIADLEQVYQDEGFEDILSRADMWALLGIWSIQESINRNNEDCIRQEFKQYCSCNKHFYNILFIAGTGQEETRSLLMTTISIKTVKLCQTFKSLSSGDGR